jgi:PAS domain S-box-containing protein
MMKKNSSEKKIILHLEDSPEDAELIENILRRGELIFDIYLISELSEFKELLKTIKPDVILSDFDLPGFDGFEALKIAIENAVDIPFIFVTGAVGEEMAVTALKSGATDFILKNNLGRLVPAVERAMDESKIASERKKLYYTLKNNEERYRTLMENLPVGVYRSSFASPGRIIQANLSAAHLHGFNSIEEFMEVDIEKLYFEPEDREKFLSELLKFKKVKNRLIRYKKTTGEKFWGSVSATCHFDKSDNPDWIDGVVEDITERVENERELKSINEELDLLISSLSSIIIGVSVKDRVTHWNPFAEKVFDIKAEDIIGKQFAESGIKWNWEEVYEAIGNSVINEKSVRIDELRFEKSDGGSGILGFNINPLKRGGDVLEGFMILGRDITEKKIIETQLLQTNKLEAIGQLAAGVAHEINSPLQYVGDNIKFLNKSFTGLSGLLEIFMEASRNINDPELCNKTMKQADEMTRKIKLPFLLEQLPMALEQSLDGVDRVSKIVQSMKAFSHPGTGSKMPANINKSIENTVTISRNEWKYDCELELNLDPELPPVPCFESELNQVILNLIVNAADAVHEAKLKDKTLSGLIKIYTTQNNGYAVIKVEDNGSGIPERIKKRIFDPFFTTKDVGKGTGQGLAISHSIIVEKHGGMLYFESEAGHGTVFYIKLPLEED